MAEKIEQWKEDYIIVKHIFLDFADYPNLKISFPIGMFLILAAISFCTALFFINKKKQTVALVAKSLIRYDAISPESAKNLKALRLDIPAVKSALMRGGPISSIVSRAGYKKPSFSEYEKMNKAQKDAVNTINFEAELFFLNPDKRKLADSIAENDQSSVAKTVILSVVLLFIFAALFVFMPDILTLVNNWLA